MYLLRYVLRPITCFKLYFHVKFQLQLGPAFYYDADPDPTFHFDADPDPDPASQNDAATFRS